VKFPSPGSTSRPVKGETYFTGLDSSFLCLPSASHPVGLPLAVYRATTPLPGSKLYRLGEVGVLQIPTLE